MAADRAQRSSDPPTSSSRLLPPVLVLALISHRQRPLFYSLSPINPDSPVLSALSAPLRMIPAVLPAYTLSSKIRLMELTGQGG